METRLSLRRGMLGTKNPLARKSRCNDHGLIGVRMDWHETDLRIAVKNAGEIWRPRQKLWELSWDAVRILGIGHRVVES